MPDICVDAANALTISTQILIQVKDGILPSGVYWGPVAFGEKRLYPVQDNWSQIATFDHAFVVTDMGFRSGTAEIG